MRVRLTYLAIAVSLLPACRSAPANEGGGVTTDMSSSSSGTDGSSSSSSSTTNWGVETGTETETGETSLTFVPDGDFPGLCSLSELSLCDEFLQDCPEGEKCVPFMAEPGCGYPRCVMITGDKPAGEPCTIVDEGGDDCDEFSWCYPGSFDPDQSQVCVAFCGGLPEDPICAESLACAWDRTGYYGPLGCRPACNPLMPEGCESFERCTLGSYNQTQLACVIAGGSANGEACDVNQDCDAGLCVEAASLLACAGEACCSAWCDLMAPDCAMGLECVPVEVDDPNSTVGVCGLPPP